jgi:hypothetical protein
MVQVSGLKLFTLIQKHVFFYMSTLKMEAALSSETLVSYLLHYTNNSEDLDLNLNRCRDLKFHIMFVAIKKLNYTDQNI